MGAQLRVYRRRIRSVQATKKITKAMELIASSRIVKAQQRLHASEPYLIQLNAAISAAATTAADVRKHPLMSRPDAPQRAAVLIVEATEPGFALVEVGLVAGGVAVGQTARAELDAGVGAGVALDAEFRAEFEIGDLAAPVEELVFRELLSGGD